MQTESDTQAIKATAPRTPADSLARQVELLEAIRESLDRQQGVVLHLAEQQLAQLDQLSRLTEWVSHTDAALFPEPDAHPGRQWVKVQDVNVPFLNLSMFLVKLSLASIPAALVLWLIGLLVVVALFSLSGLSTLIF